MEKQGGQKTVDIEWCTAGGKDLAASRESNVRANSLTALLAARPDLYAERYSMLPYKQQGNLTNIPLYAV